MERGGGHAGALGGRMHGLLEGRTPHVVGDGKCRRIFVGKISKSQTRPKSCRAEVLKWANDHMDQSNRQALPGPERTRKGCTPLYYYFIPLVSVMSDQRGGSRAPGGWRHRHWHCWQGCTHDSCSAISGLLGTGQPAGDRI